MVGAGWAGLAAAVEGTARGAQVTLYETAHRAGGRSRTLGQGDRRHDNGQHILIGAYSATLGLMRDVGLDPEALLHRLPLVLAGPDGQGLVLRPGPPALAFALAVLRQHHWPWGHRLALLLRAARWRLQGFVCPAHWTVSELCAGLPDGVVKGLLDPLCVAALNTSIEQASAQVFLRVLRDAVFGGPGSADLLLPRAPLSDLLPEPALGWLRQRGAHVRLGQRVQTLSPDPTGGWRVNADPHDQVVLACSCTEAARLVAELAPAWAAIATQIRHEPIVTMWLRDPHLQLPYPMVALPATPGMPSPAQFAFDLGALGQTPGHFTFVVSTAAPLLEQGLAALTEQVLAQARWHFVGHFLQDDTVVHTAAERRATFSCTPGLVRTPARIAHGLMAAGDHVEGPYPGTLEGAVRAGREAAKALV